MKYAYLHVSLAAVALAAFATLERAGAVTAQGGGGGGGSNWYLRAPNGSSQGPYGLSQLGEWSRAGYVSADSQVQWGAGGPPQALSSVLGAGGGAFGGALAGGASSEDGGGGGGGRRGDDDTSEDGGYDYRAAASSQLWGDDSEEEQPYRPTGNGGRGSARPGGGTRDEWGSLVSERVTAVEGGRWSESVSAAKGTFKKLFTVGRKSDNRQKRVNGGRGSGRGRGGGRSRGGGGRYPPGAGEPGRGGRGYSQGRGSSYGASRGGSGDGGWNSGGRGSGYGQGGGEWGGVQGAGGVNRGDPWQTNSQGSSAQPLSQQQQQQGLGEAGGVSTPPPPPATAAYPPPPPPVPSPVSPELRDGEGGGQGQGVAWDAAGSGGGGSGGGGVASLSAIPEEVAPPPPPPNPFPGQMPPSAEGYSPSPLGSSGAARSSPAAPAAGAAMGGLDPREIEAFYAAQKEYGAGSGPAAGDAQPRKRMGWGRRGKDIPKEDLTAMGLNYGEADREPVRERSPRRRGRSGWFGFAKGSRGRREVLGGRVSVDSMKLKYEEGWNVEAQGEGGVFAAVKSVAGRSISRMTSPSKAVTSMTPVAGVRLLARAGGVFPLLLWWAFSVMRGVLPVVMSWLVSRLLHQLADFSAGRYTLSTSHYRECRSACLKLLGQQAGAGLSLAVAAGVVRGWLRPRARERSAAVCRRALAGVSVAGGIDRPPPSEFRELSLAPWSYMQQVMELSRGVAGVAAVVAVLQTVWPFRGPVTLGGGAAVLLLLEGIRTLLATEDPGAAEVRGSGSGSDVAEPSGGIHGGASGGAVASAEAEARGLRKVLLSKNSAVLEAAEHQEGRKSRVITTRSVVRGSVTWLVMAAFAVYALVSVVEEELAFQFGTARVTLVITQVWLAYASLQGALNGLSQVARLRPTATRMQAIALARPESGGGGKETGLGTEGGWSNDGPEAADGLRLQGVSFTPSGRTRQALSSVDLHAPAGSVLAVLGGAGAGKTALLQLALGLMKADEGEAMFQGRPLQEWETGAYRERVAWLSQVSGRFGLTAGENIGAGDPSEFSNRELWARAAGLSGANTAIESLPLGYDTLLEDGGGPAAAAAAGGGGSGLSEGEWQRLHLARFLMRADVAKLLLLDEPFKGVSPSEASRMLAALGAQARATGQVVVVASQDLSLGRWADATVYLEDGSVSESGRWDDLLASGGPFATAVREHDAF